MKKHVLVLLVGLLCALFGCSPVNKVDIEAEKEFMPGPAGAAPGDTTAAGQ